MPNPSIVDVQTRSSAVSNTSNAAAARAFKRRQLRVSRAQVNRFRGGVRQPRAQELAYTRALRRLLVRWEKIVRRELEPILSQIAEPPPPPPGGIRYDADSRVEAVLARLRIQALEFFGEEPLDEVAGEVGANVARANAAQQSRVMGIDFRADLVGVAELQAFRTANVNLIQSIPARQLSELQKVLDEAPTLQVRQLRAKIEQRFQVARSRADLIARDQVLKLNGQLTKTRQQRAGVTEYIWITSRDERVRDAHSDLDGTRQRWDSPPVSSEDGRTNHPGEDYQCRCVAQPVIPALDT